MVREGASKLKSDKEIFQHLLIYWWLLLLDLADEIHSHISVCLCLCICDHRNTKKPTPESFFFARACWFSIALLDIKWHSNFSSSLFSPSPHLHLMLLAVISINAIYSHLFSWRCRKFIFKPCRYRSWTQLLQ